MKKFTIFKKVALSLASLSLSTVLITNFFVSNNSNISKSSIGDSKQAATTTTDLTSPPVYLDSQPISNETITSFNSYSPSYEDNNVAQISQLNGSIGLSSDKKTITFTSYDGFLVWSSNLTQNVLLQKYYAQTQSINDISSYTVINYVSIASTGYIAVLFGSPTNTNEVLFAINLNTGYIYTQPNVSNIDLNSNKNFVKINDGVNLLYVNSQYQIIATTGDTTSQYSLPRNTVVISFSNDVGFGIIPSPSSIVQPQNTNDLLLGFMPATSNTNFAVFLSATPTSDTLDVFNGTSSVSTPVYKFNYYAYVVDNNLKAIGSPVNLSSAYYSSTNTLDFSNIKKRFFSTTTSNISSAWFWCDSGIKQKSGVTKLVYDGSTIAETFYGAFDDSDLAQSGINYNNLVANSIAYDYENQNVLISFSYQQATNNYQILNEDISLSDGSTAKSSWINKTGITYLAPMYSNSNANLSKTYAISYNTGGSSLFLNDNNSFIEQTSIPITFNKVNDVINAITSNAIYTNKMPSQITTDDLKNCITFAVSPTSTYSVTVSNLQPNDNTGTLSFSYNVAYTINYGSDSINYSFNFSVNLTGLFSLDNDFKLNFITHSSSDDDSTIDTKYQNIQNLKNTTVPSNITQQEILDYFLDYSIVGNTGQNLAIQTNWITLNPDDSQGSLGVTVSIPASSMPEGFPSSKLTASYTYTGFTNLQGYTKQIITSSDSITQLKQIKYASQISFSDIINNFVTLGSSYSRDPSDWTFTVDSSGTNNYTGTLSFRLIYTSSNLPAGTSDDVKNVFGTPTTWYQISGFKTIFSNYDNVSLSIQGYSGLSDANSLWTQFENAVSNNNLSSSILYNSIDVNQWLNSLYLSNFSDLSITCNNLDTADSDGYLLLGVGYNDNVTTNLNISGSNFVFNSTAKTNFEAHFGNNYPFVVKWSLTKYEPEFHWVVPSMSSAITSMSDDSITINLNKSSFQGLDNTMRASDVTAENITGLFEISNYEIINQPQLFANNIKGTLKAIITLEPKSSSSDVRSDQTVTKNVYITGFKIDAPDAAIIVPIIISVICALVIIAAIIWIIAWKQKQNKFMYMQNLKKKKR